MKLYRVVEFIPRLGTVVPIHNRLYRSKSQAKAMRTRHLGSMNLEDLRRRAQLVFIEETDTEWVKS